MLSRGKNIKKWTSNIYKNIEYKKRKYIKEVIPEDQLWWVDMCLGAEMVVVDLGEGSLR